MVPFLCYKRTRPICNHDSSDQLFCGLSTNLIWAQQFASLNERVTLSTLISSERTDITVKLAAVVWVTSSGLGLDQSGMRRHKHTRSHFRNNPKMNHQDECSHILYHGLKRLVFTGVSFFSILRESEWVSEWERERERERVETTTKMPEMWIICFGVRFG